MKIEIGGWADLASFLDSFPLFNGEPKGSAESTDIGGGIIRLSITLDLIPVFKASNSDVPF